MPSLLLLLIIIMIQWFSIRTITIIRIIDAEQSREEGVNKNDEGSAQWPSLFSMTDEGLAQWPTTNWLSGVLWSPLSPLLSAFVAINRRSINQSFPSFSLPSFLPLLIVRIPFPSIFVFFALSLLLLLFYFFLFCWELL